MRIGVVVPMSMSDGTGEVPSWPEVLAFTERAEALGLHSVWVCDHLISSPPGRPAEGIHEWWTILSALAASTSRVELGQLVMCASFRNPALLAKMAATADAVSKGRLILGLGAGWYDPEYEAFGYPTDHRVGRFEEALRIIGPLLRGESVAFNGRYHEGRDAATLRRTVGMHVLDPDVTTSDNGDDVAFGGSVDELARAIDAYEALAFDDVIVALQPMTGRSLDRLAEALQLRGR